MFVSVRAGDVKQAQGLEKFEGFTLGNRQFEIPIPMPSLSWLSTVVQHFVGRCGRPENY